MPRFIVPPMLLSVNAAGVPVVPAVVPVTVSTPLLVDKLTFAPLANVKLPPIFKLLPLLAVLMLFARFTLPVVEKSPPVTVIGALALNVMRPLLWKARLPPVVVKPFWIAKVEPNNVALPALTLLLKLNAPVSLLLLDKLVRPLMMLLNVTLPEPLFKLSACAPPTVLLKSSAPLLLELSNAASAPSVTAPV